MTTAESSAGGEVPGSVDQSVGAQSPLSTDPAAQPAVVAPSTTPTTIVVRTVPRYHYYVDDGSGAPPSGAGSGTGTGTGSGAGGSMTQTAPSAPVGGGQQSAPTATPAPSSSAPVATPVPSTPKCSGSKC